MSPEIAAVVVGVDGVRATKELYAARGLDVGKSYSGKYVEFDGSHRLVVPGSLGGLTDPDGDIW